MFHNSKLFPYTSWEHFWKTNLTQVMLFLISSFFPLRHCDIILFSQCGRNSNYVFEIALRLHLFAKLQRMINISANFIWIAKFFKWVWNDFLRSSFKFTCLIASKQCARIYTSKINFWSHLHEELPEHPENFHSNPLHGSMNSIKSADNLKIHSKSRNGNMSRAFCWTWNHYFIWKFVVQQMLSETKIHLGPVFIGFYFKASATYETN